MSDFTIERVIAANDELRALIRGLEADLAQGYLPEQQHGLPIDALFQPHIHFFLARDATGAAIACGGVALFAKDGFAEVKRMFVRPESRGRGAAEAILSRIESVVREARIARLTLETGDKQHAAIKLYQRYGFQRCEPFGDYLGLSAKALETSVFFEKLIEPIWSNRFSLPT